MFEKYEIFSMAKGLASHAAARHSVIASNVAHADTPGYRAMDIASFSDAYQTGTAGSGMRTTRSAHMSMAAGPGSSARSFETTDPNSPNGNSVSLETEMVKASEVRHQHELALSIYSTSLDILRASLGRR